MDLKHYGVREGENCKITVDDVPIFVSKVPSLLEILKLNGSWKHVYDQVPGDFKGLMTESVIDHFHAYSIETVDRLNHAGYTPDQISMETGLMPAKVDVIFEMIGSDKRVQTPGDVVLTHR